ncbi:hypothetical protein IDJ77_00975 [Mucilaginibacter sp. ZT4R22]|uniref:DUF5000 domain-containing protein n=1 Tax=Mucilaginibacter pankratovii TaxID=2772110 RepID=A0ABR7WJ62_9SPHI|nr:DUF4998 domain-containing protein [Mucilaginibacter pankratovii]MBD1362367.1 hypothetical protein [Mucilaginibacter pankratovii]
MKNILNISLFCCILLGLLGCSHDDKDFKNFLKEKEVTYPGLVAKIHAKSGNLRAALVWNPSPDPSITKYVIYWNNKADSITLTSTNHNTADSITAIIPGLNEYIYSFTIYSYDAKGNRSIPLDINNVKVYGPIYRSGLLNRTYNAANPFSVSDNGNIRLNFLPRDTSVVNIGTDIKYTNRDGIEVVKQLKPDSLGITLTDYKSGVPVQFRSSYIPDKNSIDTFFVANYGTFPAITGIAQCNKALFRENRLNGDAGTYSGETTVSRLWDGSNGPQGYPNIFHSDGDHGMPHTITFDMGKVYKKLTSIEEIGRNCCNNPDQFEIWGIANISGAETSLSPKDGGWSAEMVAKGWTLLKDITRTDDGQQAKKYDFGTVPPVRYIRVRIKHVTTGDGNYSNMSEMTFWNDVLN